ncbi:beta-N-acetylhexosaminidase [Arthrobacter sp. V4I6]|uniref:glycoside hydrolase family 3 N-terminal domain-containing protein n=1 Tax=unclassified Arthrobacter TaxID=235627 RepID=UPI0027818FBE|nr:MULTISPECIES: glycoside hydrolase family 3 N-terminal domain-containing protein [unclassified Arthrobacter]MDQ0820036.1 beta-N-acetylhexosaminidase [Arthrobacter sp. V1I7]MDQ0854218.1 beta-N-acetylhexosaminidase [Arthrobacter sp. V4I6]
MTTHAAVLAALLGLVLGTASCSGPPTPEPSVRQPTPEQTAAAPSPESPSPTPAAPADGPGMAGSLLDPGSRPLGWGPQQQDADAARRAVDGMSLEQQAGQVLLPFYPGLDHETRASDMERLHLAGSIIMGDNVPKTSGGQVDTGAMSAVTHRLQSAATADGRSWPGMIAVDQEGGAVARLRAPLTEWPAPMSYGAAGSGPLASEAGRAVASELSALGFNVDFAPTVDVTMGPSDPTIGARSMSGSADTAADLGVAFSRGMLAAGMLPAAKHFPGHGSVSVDSHEGLPVQPASLDQLRAKDLLPFQAAIDAGLPMVMTGHIAVPALEPGVPASVSKAAYAELRGMGFRGVAVTDALNMGAVKDRFPHGSVAPLALAAGADLLLMPADVGAAHAAIISSVRSGALAPERLAEAAQRVVTMMVWRGRTGAPKGSEPGIGTEISRKVSAAAITVLAGPCSGPMVPPSVRFTGGTDQDRSRFAAAARDVGISIGEGPLVSLIGYGRPPADPEAPVADVAVTLDAPWALAASAAPAKIALYGRSQGAFDALAAVLAGKAAAPGKLPVAVGAYNAGTGCG